MMPNAAKLIIEVLAGVVPEQPIDHYTKRWVWTSDDQALLVKGDEEAKLKWVTMNGTSREYQASLEDPSKVNWVRRDWLWL